DQRVGLDGGCALFACTADSRPATPPVPPRRAGTWGSSRRRQAPVPSRRSPTAHRRRTATQGQAGGTVAAEHESGRVAVVTNIGLCTALAYHLRMKLSQYNKFLRSRPEADAALLISAKTSSAVEGIRQPFVQDAKLGTVGDTRACTERWKRRAASRSAR